MKMSKHSTQMHQTGPLAASNPRGVKIKGDYKK